MTSLALQLDRYLVMRRDFGHDLSTSERVLRRFVEFAGIEGADRITVGLFLRWKECFGSADINTWASRLGMVRGFASWLQGIDPLTEVPPSGLVGGKLRRKKPYIYKPDEIAAIVEHASRLPSAYGLRGWTYATLFGLIAVSGLRINEAIQLDDDDVDTGAATLFIRRGKGGKPRIVPTSACVAARLEAYRAERNRILRGGHAPFFLLDTSLRPTDCSARYNFAHVCQRAGIREETALHRHGRGPRVHDLRHTFAVRTILEWFRKGLDPDREMIVLSAYLGHTGPEHTYWYIEAVPELLQLASQRAERSLAGGGSK